MRGLFLSLAREESAPARAFYLQAWSGGSYTFDRIGRGTVTVDDARLSIIGGIQPGPLSELVQQARRGAADDGMIERFLIAWPDAPGEWREVDRLPDSEGKRRAWETFERLDALRPARWAPSARTDMHGEPRGLPFVRFDDDAREAFGEWRSEFERTIRAAEGEGLEGALSKFRHHVPALALALHVIDGGTGPVTLPRHAARAGARGVFREPREAPAQQRPAHDREGGAHDHRQGPRRMRCPSPSRRATCTATSGQG